MEFFCEPEDKETEKKKTTSVSEFGDLIHKQINKTVLAKRVAFLALNASKPER